MFEKIDDPRFGETFFAVEATSAEKHLLWFEHHADLGWKEECRGLLLQIGKVAGHPVCVGVSWAFINGRRILFYEGTSQVVDHQVIRDWVEFQAPHLRAGRMGDAANFHNCLASIRQ